MSRLVCLLYISSFCCASLVCLVGWFGVFGLRALFVCFDWVGLFVLLVS